MCDPPYICWLDASLGGGHLILFAFFCLPCSLCILSPEATILFADISGFTAWSSIREAGQVFTLLETIFQAFDDIAKHHHVFKVEVRSCNSDCDSINGGWCLHLRSICSNLFFVPFP